MFSSKHFFQALRVKPTLLCQALGALPVGSLAPPAVFGVQSRVVLTTWLVQLPAPIARLALGITAHFWEAASCGPQSWLVMDLSSPYPCQPFLLSLSVTHVSALSLVSVPD